MITTTKEYLKYFESILSIYIRDEEKQFVILSAINTLMEMSRLDGKLEGINETKEIVDKTLRSLK